MKKGTLISSVVSVALGMVMVGCGKAPDPAPATAATPPPVPDVKVNADAGVEVVQSTDAAALPKLYAQKAQAPRKDPFALTSTEANFDKQQLAEKVLGGSGFFGLEYQEPEDKEAQVEIEAQPPRRLLGVIVGDAVVAIIDMGNGQTELIRPGMKIPNSEWTVVSIDGDKAVLRRSGQKLPREIVVKLEPPQAGLSAPTGGTPGGNMGGPTAGGPGGTGGAKPGFGGAGALGGK